LTVHSVGDMIYLMSLVPFTGVFPALVPQNVCCCCSINVIMLAASSGKHNLASIHLTHLFFLT